MSKRPFRNRLNDLDPKSWLKFQKSWFIHNPPPRRKDVLRHPAKLDLADCPRREAAERYLVELGRRQEREAQTLATLTGWDVDAIRAKAVAAPDGEAQQIAPVGPQGALGSPFARLWRWLQREGAQP